MTCSNSTFHHQISMPHYCKKHNQRFSSVDTGNGWAFTCIYCRAEQIASRKSESASFHMEPAAGEYSKISTRDMALALQRGPEDGFYKFEIPVYWEGTTRRKGVQIFFVCGDTKKMEAAYSERIKVIAAEEEIRMSLSDVATSRLKKAVEDRQAAGHYHCFTVSNFGHQEVVTATYVEICDELNHRERQEALDILSELDDEILELIIERVQTSQLEAVTFDIHPAHVTWTPEDLIEERLRRKQER